MKNVLHPNREAKRVKEELTEATAKTSKKENSAANQESKNTQ